MRTLIHANQMVDAEGIERSKVRWYMLRDAHMGNEVNRQLNFIKTTNRKFIVWDGSIKEQMIHS
jgi:hypothetical protein